MRRAGDQVLLPLGDGLTLARKRPCEQCPRVVTLDGLRLESFVNDPVAGADAEARAMPPPISSTPLTGPAELIVSSDWGTARSWTLAIRPSVPMKTMSSGISVFFIHIDMVWGAGRMNSMPASGANCSRNISPCAIWRGVSAISIANGYLPPEAVSMVRRPVRKISAA